MLQKMGMGLVGMVDKAVEVVKKEVKKRKPTAAQLQRKYFSTIYDKYKELFEGEGEAAEHDALIKGIINKSPPFFGALHEKEINVITTIFRNKMVNDDEYKRHCNFRSVSVAMKRMNASLD